MGGQGTQGAPHGVKVRHGAWEDVATGGSSLGATGHRRGCRTVAAKGSWKAQWPVGVGSRGELRSQL